MSASPRSLRGRRRALTLLTTLCLAACASLPPDARLPPDTAWRVVTRSAAQEVAVRGDAAAWLATRPRLAAVTLAPGDPALAASFEPVRARLAERLQADLPGPAATTLHVQFSAPQPASPALNVLTALLVFVPLDAGGITVEAQVRNPAGEAVAVWRERVQGDLTDIGRSFSDWGRVAHALDAWATRCVQNPPWLPGPGTPAS